MSIETGTTMSAAKFTNEEIADGLHAYFMSARELKKLDDFDRMVTVPSKAKLFALQAPEMVKQLFNSRAVKGLKR